MNNKKFLSPMDRPKAVCLFSAFFALFYHVAFLFVFLKLKIYPLFYFNIASVVIFVSMLLSVKKVKNYLIAFLISDAEVICHQILADYFLGGEASFHYLMLITGFLAFLIYVGNPKMSISLSILPISLFVICEIFSPFILPVVEISRTTLFCIKLANVSLSVIVLTFMILIFASIVHNIENDLEAEVAYQSEKLQVQNEHIINMQNNTILSLSNLVENRDYDTGEHIRRTSEYTIMLAQAARNAGFYVDVLTDEYINLLYRAAPMHDIGKIVITDLILKKPGKLEAHEFEVMKCHTTEGGRIIQEVLAASEDEAYIEVASDIAISHHERWDGKGYPYGLAGEKIPLCARIMAIVDVFDALVSERCYKKAYSLEETFKIIRNSSGTHFDPVLTEVFLDNKKKIMKISSQYKD
ncbi:MAG: HD domain-containing protein [Treponemataceae bacterium]|nr:HD domain-containing protein [Treponemataceae bacterium]